MLAKLATRQSDVNRTGADPRQVSSADTPRILPEPRFCLRILLQTVHPGSPPGMDRRLHWELNLGCVPALKSIHQ